MTKTFKASEDGWIDWKDFVRPIIGREDPSDLIDQCWEYLADEHAAPPSAQPAHPKKVAGELVAAKIRASAIGIGPDSDLRRQVQRQQVAIDRLLAFVPKRMRRIPPERLGEIAREIARVAREVFGVDGVIVTASDESDEDTVACHRVLVDVPVADAFDVEGFVRSTMDLNRSAAALLSPEEFQAVRLFIEPMH